MQPQHNEGIAKVSQTYYDFIALVSLYIKGLFG